MRKRAYQPRIGRHSASDAVVAFGKVWLTADKQHRLIALDPSTGRPKGAAIPLPGRPHSIAADRRSLWISLYQLTPTDQDRLLQVNPKTGKVVKNIAFPTGIQRVAASPKAVWAVNRKRQVVTRIDVASGAMRQFFVGTQPAADVVYGAGSIWVAGEQDDSVFRINPATGDQISIAVGSRPRQLAVRGNHVYVTNFNSSTLIVIDATRNRVVGEPVDVPINPFAVAAGPGAVWVASVGENKLAKLTGRGV
jgi:YVTN family beta-propeller protein